jgi:hypothetical protein
MSFLYIEGRLMNSYLLNLSPQGLNLPFFTYDKLVLGEAQKRLQFFRNILETVLAEKEKNLSKKEIIELLTRLQPEHLKILDGRKKLYEAILKHEENPLSPEEKDFLEMLVLSVKAKTTEVEIKEKTAALNKDLAELDTIPASEQKQEAQHGELLNKITNLSYQKEVEDLLPRLTKFTEEYKNDLEKDVRKIAKKSGLTLEDLEQEMVKPSEARKPELKALLEKVKPTSIAIEKYLAVKDTLKVLTSPLSPDEKIELFCQKTEANQALYDTHRDSAGKRFLAEVGRILLFFLVVAIGLPASLPAWLPLSIVNNYGLAKQRLATPVNRALTAEDKVVTRKSDFFQRPEHTKGQYLVAQAEKLQPLRKKSQ